MCQAAPGCLVEIHYQIQCMYVVSGFLRVVFNSEVLPFHEVVELPVDHLTV